MSKSHANRYGTKYGYTGLFPVCDAANGLALRRHLNGLDSHPYGSPFSDVTRIHLLRFIVIDRLPFEGYPYREETLSVPYLIVMCDFDGKSVADLAGSLVCQAPGPTYEVWRHCVKFPFQTANALGAPSAATELGDYLTRGQVKTLLYLSDRPDATVPRILRSMVVQSAFSAFVADHQTANAATLKRKFVELWKTLEAKHDPHPGSL
jgi:hypothetical protein